MIKKCILVVDDEKLIRWSLENKLSSLGYSVTTAEDATTAMARLKEQIPDLVLLDIKLPDGSGMDILEFIRSVTSDVPVILITAEGTVESAVRAMKLGAYDYLMKPFNLDELQVLVERALEQADLRKSLDFYEADKAAQTSRDRLIGSAPAYLEVLEMVRKVATSPVATVLVLGESGTGKNLIARRIHQLSDRASKPFVTIECTTISEHLLESELFGHEKGAFTDASATKKGLFELANGGTVFVDEIGDMPLNMQPKLLRAIEEKRFKRVGGVVDFDVDVRVVAATNMDLEEAIAQKAFRRDLFYRLNVVPVSMPPLRDRTGDAVLLAEFFMAEFSRQFGKEFSRISDEAKRLLSEYNWPGNVRELRNSIERVVLLESGSTIEAEHLVLKQKPAEPGTLENARGTGLTMDEMESELINQALSSTNGNQTQAAKILGITRDVLRYRMKKHGITS